MLKTNGVLSEGFRPGRKAMKTLVALTARELLDLCSGYIAALTVTSGTACQLVPVRIGCLLLGA